MRWLTWLVVAACSSGSPAPEHPQAVPPAHDPASPPDDRACDELITHAVKLGIDEQAGHAEPHATPADHEAVRRKLHEDFMAGCRTLSRDAFRCAMTAATLPALAACQPTPSSSTSNSSVAPGGMRPPAPRSP